MREDFNINKFLRENEREKPFFSIIYGRSGSGKSTLIDELCSELPESKLIVAGEWHGMQSFEEGFDTLINEIVYGDKPYIVFDSLRLLVIGAFASIPENILSTEWSAELIDQESGVDGVLNRLYLGTYITVKLKDGTYACGRVINRKGNTLFKGVKAINLFGVSLDLSLLEENEVIIAADTVMNGSFIFRGIDTIIYPGEVANVYINKYMHGNSIARFSGMRQGGISNFLFYILQRLDDIAFFFNKSLFMIINPTLEDAVSYESLSHVIKGACRTVIECVKENQKYNRYLLSNRKRSVRNDSELGESQDESISNNNIIFNDINSPAANDEELFIDMMSRGV